MCGYILFWLGRFRSLCICSVNLCVYSRLYPHISTKVILHFKPSWAQMHASITCYNRSQYKKTVGRYRRAQYHFERTICSCGFPRHLTTIVSNRYSSEIRRHLRWHPNDRYRRTYKFSLKGTASFFLCGHKPVKYIGSTTHQHSNLKKKKLEAEKWRGLGTFCYPFLLFLDKVFSL